MIQPVVKQPIKCLYTRYNRLSNQFDNQLYRVYKHSTGCQTRLTTILTTGCIVYTAGCQTGCTAWFDNRLNEQWLFVQHGCQTGCTTRFNNRSDNRLYHVNKHPTGCQTGMTTGCTPV